MRNRADKCPGCGLVNFRDAFECQWCALALSGRTRAEYVDDAPAGPGRPWGLLLLLFAVVTVGGGLIRHVAQKAAARAEAAAEAEKEAAKKRTGPPALSGRSPSDPPPYEDVISEWIKENNEKAGRSDATRRRWREDFSDYRPRDIRDRGDEEYEYRMSKRPEEAWPAPTAPDDPQEQ